MAEPHAHARPLSFGRARPAFAQAGRSLPAIGDARADLDLWRRPQRRDGPSKRSAPDLIRRSRAAPVPTSPRDISEASRWNDPVVVEGIRRKVAIADALPGPRSGRMHSGRKPRQPARGRGLDSGPDGRGAEGFVPSAASAFRRRCQAGRSGRERSRSSASDRRGKPPSTTELMPGDERGPPPPPRRRGEKTRLAPGDLFGLPRARRDREGLAIKPVPNRSASWARVIGGSR